MHPRQSVFHAPPSAPNREDLSCVVRLAVNWRSNCLPKGLFLQESLTDMRDGGQAAYVAQRTMVASSKVQKKVQVMVQVIFK
jgi:hypothetical protein